MLELNQNAWFVRLFFWSLSIWKAFKNDHYKYSENYVRNNGTNLCFFIRCTVVYMPLVLLLHLAFAVAAVVSITALPIYLFGGIAYTWTLLASVGVVALIGCIREISRRQNERENARRAREAKEHLNKEPEQDAPARQPRGPNFFEVIGAYLVAKKKKICPSIAFARPEEVQS